MIAAAAAVDGAELTAMPINPHVARTSNTRVLQDDQMHFASSGATTAEAISSSANILHLFVLVRRCHLRSLVDFVDIGKARHFEGVAKTTRVYSKTTRCTSPQVERLQPRPSPRRYRLIGFFRRLGFGRRRRRRGGKLSRVDQDLAEILYDSSSGGR
jgi:hypothetical protein